jgi:hypothetical protein
LCNSRTSPTLTKLWKSTNKRWATGWLVFHSKWFINNVVKYTKTKYNGKKKISNDTNFKNGGQTNKQIQTQTRGFSRHYDGGSINNIYYKQKT